MLCHIHSNRDEKMELVDSKFEYEKNQNIKKEDVTRLIEWTDKQNHLPKLTELEAILFLNCCYPSIEKAKLRLDAYYTQRTVYTDFFSNRNFENLRLDMDIVLYFPIEKLTPENDRVILIKFLNSDPSRFDLNKQLKLFFMINEIWLMKYGAVRSFQLVLDSAGMQLGHLGKFSVLSIKRVLNYLQDALPLRPGGIHLINVGPVVDKILFLAKPFIRKDLLNLIISHTNGIESLYEYVPKVILPEPLGGDGPTIEEMQEILRIHLQESGEYFENDERTKRVNESKRVVIENNITNNFGIEGSFKRLTID